MRTRRPDPPPARRPILGRATHVLVALASLVFSLSQLSLIGSRLDPAREALVYVLVALSTGIIAVLYAVPTGGLLLHLVAAVGIHAIGVPGVVLGLAPIIATYIATTYAPTSRQPALLASMGAATVWVGFGFEDAETSTVISNLIAVTVAWAFGWLSSRRLRDIDALRERTHQLEQAREELAVLAVADERLRIARELHDVVAHNLSVIAVQAGAGAHIAEQRPDQAREALSTIGEVSRAALDEMRRVLGVLRTPDAASTAPLPGVAAIATLVDTMRATGLDVDLRVEGAPRPLPPAVDLACYRIAQEALTNVLRHAPDAHAVVRVVYEPDDVRVEVDDDGRGGRHTAAAGGGHGLTGMRERVDVFGGSFDAGPSLQGGFRVRARVPDSLPEASA